MTARTVRFRRRAQDDFAAIQSHYLHEAGEAVALDFTDRVDAAVSLIADQPRAGSRRYAIALGVPNLRVWRVRTYPYLIFYVELSERIELWRILHARRDIPLALSIPDDAHD